MSYSRSGSAPASRSVALDLMLRTFMNSSEFHSSHPKVWESISKLVPGTTPQQCCERWEELRCLTGGSVAGDYSELTAHGRPLSQRTYSQCRQMAKFVRSVLNSPSSNGSTSSFLPSDVSPVRTQSHCEGIFTPRVVGECERQHVVQRRGREGRRGSQGGGKFVANFYQSMVNKQEERREGGVEGGRMEEKREDSGEGDGMEDRLERRDKKETQSKELVAGRGRSGDGRGGAGGKKESGREEEGKEEERGGERKIKRQLSAADKQLDHGHGSNKKPLAVSHDADMIIHVFDEQRKSKRDFHCPRGVLVKEMCYFSEYLSSDTQLWDEVDISVHCDIPVFEWLMRYAKRGLYEGPRGEILDAPLEPPSLEPETVVSILISSDFLKMDSLVEECLDFCHQNFSAVLASPTNMGCISDKLRRRLATKFTPMEVEGIADKRDKIRSKLFVHKIQDLFSPTHNHSECPASAATLHRCKHCGKLLTSEQCSILPCTTSRLEVHHAGQLVYRHERDEGWSVSGHLTHLQQQHSLTPRDIYWRLWGVINWLRCSACGRPFQCCDLASCHYHPQPTLAGRPSTGPPVHICCGSLPEDLSPFPLPQNGCCVKDHTVSDVSPSSSPDSPSLFSLLLSHRDVICSEPAASGGRERRDKPGKSRRKDSPTKTSSDTSTGNAQLNFLKTMDQRRSNRRVVNASSTPHAGPSQLRVQSAEGGISNSRLMEGTDAKEHGTVENVVGMETSSSARRQMLSESSELEEDEERGSDKPAPPLHLPGQVAQRHRRESNRSTTHRSSSVRKRHCSAPSVAVEWVWDSSKPRRWNQDRQRESDERRLSLLCDQMSQTAVLTPHNLTSSTPHALTGQLRDNVSSGEKDTSFAGGIFSQLEAQFRVQQAARALQPLAHGAGSRFFGRKKKISEQF